MNSTTNFAPRRTTDPVDYDANLTGERQEFDRDNASKRRNTDDGATNYGIYRSEFWSLPGFDVAEPVPLSQPDLAATVTTAHSDLKPAAASDTDPFSFVLDESATTPPAQPTPVTTSTSPEVARGLSKRVDLYDLRLYAPRRDSDGPNYDAKEANERYQAHRTSAFSYRLATDNPPLDYTSKRRENWPRGVRPADDSLPLPISVGSRPFQTTASPDSGPVRGVKMNLIGPTASKRPNQVWADLRDELRLRWLSMFGPKKPKPAAAGTSLTPPPKLKWRLALWITAGVLLALLLGMFTGMELVSMSPDYRTLEAKFRKADKQWGLWEKAANEQTERANGLDRSLKTSAGKLKEAQDKIAILEPAVERGRKEAEDLGGRIKDAQGKLQTAETQISNLNSAAEQRGKEMETLGGQLKEAQGRLQTAQTQISTFQSAEEQRKVEVAGLRQQVAGLQAEVAKKSVPPPVAQVAPAEKPAAKPPVKAPAREPAKRPDAQVARVPAPQPAARPATAPPAPARGKCEVEGTVFLKEFGRCAFPD